MTTRIERVVAVGASNLTLGLQSMVSASRAAFGPDVEVLAALGYGRSYGAFSSVGPRRLPGILQSGLWSELARRPEAPTRGLIMDVGNDVLYDVKPEQIIAWVEEAADRLLTHTRDVVITDLPGASIDRLSNARFLFFRTLFFPPCRLSRAEVVARVASVNNGLALLAQRLGLRIVRLQPDWYGLDPIHIRPSRWRAAWRDILMGPGDDSASVPPFSPREWVFLHQLPPERQWLMGWERVHPQTDRKLKHGGRLRLY